MKVNRNKRKMDSIETFQRRNSQVSMSNDKVLLVFGRFEAGDSPILVTGVDVDLSLDGVKRLVRSAPYRSTVKLSLPVSRSRTCESIRDSALDEMLYKL